MRHHSTVRCLALLEPRSRRPSKVVAAARPRGAPVEYLLFPGEGHEIAQPRNRARFVEATVAWLAARLGVDP